MRDTVPALAWWGIGVVLLLIIAQINQRLGGWLLLITVLGLLANSRQKGMI